MKQNRQVSQLAVLVRIQLGAMLRRYANGGSINGKKKYKKTKVGGAAIAVLLAICGVSFLAMFGMLFFVLADALIPLSLGWLYMTMALLASGMMMVVGTVFLAKSQLFEAKDNALLLSMPIRPEIILGARMLSLLLLNLIWGGIVMAPAVVCYFLVSPPGIAALLSTLVLFLAMGLFALALSCLLGWLLSVIGARIRNKTFITVFCALAFIGVYYYFCGVGMSSLLTRLTEQSELVAETLGAVVPLYHLGNAAANGNLLHLLSAALLLILPFAAVYMLLAKTFIRTVTASHSVRYAKPVRTDRLYRAKSVSHALLERENAKLLSSAVYLLNAGLGPVFLLVGAAALLWKRDMLGSFAYLGRDLLPAFFVGASCMMLGMALFSTPSVSLEAKTLSVLRSMPVSSYEILCAKWQLHVLWCAVPTAVFSLVSLGLFLSGDGSIDTAALLAAGLSPQEIAAMLPDVHLTPLDYLFDAIAILLLPQLFAIVTGGLGVIIGIRFPNLHWTNEAQVIKQGTAVAVSMFGNLGLMAVCAAAVWFGRELLPISVWLLLFTVVFAVLAWGVRWLLCNWACRAFEALQA